MSHTGIIAQDDAHWTNKPETIVDLNLKVCPVRQLQRLCCDLLCGGYDISSEWCAVKYLPITFRVASLALVQPYDRDDMLPQCQWNNIETFRQNRLLPNTTKRDPWLEFLDCTVHVSECWMSSVVVTLQPLREAHPPDASWRKFSMPYRK